MKFHNIWKVNVKANKQMKKKNIFLINEKEKTKNKN